MGRGRNRPVPRCQRSDTALALQTVYTALAFPFVPSTLSLLAPRLLHSQSPRSSVPLQLRHCALHISCAQRRVPNVCAILMCLHCSGCCNAVRVSGAADVQPMRMGTYQMVPGLTKQGRPVYRSSNGQYLYYWPAFEAWRIGPDHNSASAGVMSIDREATQCPTEPKGWVAVRSGEPVSRPITVRCVAAGVVRSTCAQGDMPSINCLWYLLGTGFRLLSVMRSSRVWIDIPRPPLLLDPQPTLTGKHEDLLGKVREKRFLAQRGGAEGVAGGFLETCATCVICAMSEDSRCMAHEQTQVSPEPDSFVRLVR